MTAQRPEDVTQMRFSDIRDGYLHVIQRKTSNKVRITLDLKLDVLGYSLREIINRCKDKVRSEYLVHHSSHVGKAKPGQKLRRQTISAKFRKIRDKSGISWAGHEPPSLYELRSLSKRLYDEQGGVDTQQLLGHKTIKMASEYADSRVFDWMEVNV